MAEFETWRINAVSKRVRSGLRTHAGSESREMSVSLANHIADFHENEGLSFELSDGENLQNVTRYVNTDTLRRLRKVTEILEDDLGIDIGHSKFVRLARAGAKLSSIASVAIAAQNLIQTSIVLDRAARKAESLSGLKSSLFHDFYRATCIFIGECFLLTSPLNFRFAWKGTRYLNNRYLYRMREFTPNLHRYILSEIHYVIRGIVPAALRAPEEFADYLVSMTVQTIEILKDQPDEKLGDIPERASELIDEFHLFVEQAYSIAPPQIDLQSVLQDVISQLTGFLDISPNSITLDGEL